MSRLTKEQFLDKSRYQFKSEDVDVPELGGSVQVKALNNRERDEFVKLSEQAEKADGKEATSLAAKALAIAISDPVLTAEEIEGVLGDQPATASDRILKEFLKLVGPQDEEEVAATRSDFRSEDD